MRLRKLTLGELFNWIFQLSNAQREFLLQDVEEEEYLRAVDVLGHWKCGTWIVNLFATKTYRCDEALSEQTDWKLSTEYSVS